MDQLLSEIDADAFEEVYLAWILADFDGMQARSCIGAGLINALSVDAKPEQLLDQTAFFPTIYQQQTKQPDGLEIARQKLEARYGNRR